MSINMENLLNDVLHAAGGLQIWKKYNILTTQIKISGIKPWVGSDSELLNNLTLQADLQGQNAQIRNFPHMGLYTIITTDDVKVYDHNDEEVTFFEPENTAAYDPSLRAPWNALQLMCFIKYVLWHNIRFPFSLDTQEYACEESQIFESNDKLYRSMLVESRHNTPYGRVMSLFFSGNNLLERTDYETQQDEPVLFTKITSQYALLNGLIMPTLIEIYYRNDDGSYDTKKPIVSVEVKSMKFL